VTDSADVIGLLSQLSAAQQREVFAHLRQLIPIHEMEKTLMAPADTILEAIARSSDLTVRGIEGIIAESSFAVEVVPTLAGWSPVKFYGDVPFDELLSDGNPPPIRVQVKMQRRKNRKPLMASEVWKSRRWPHDHFIVETQKTRSGKDDQGENTRPYRFDVGVHSSTPSRDGCFRPRIPQRFSPTSRSRLLRTTAGQTTF